MNKGSEYAFSKDDVQMANRSMRRCSASLTTREMQTKTTRDTTPHPLGQLLPNTETASAGEELERGSRGHCWWERTMEIPKKNRVPI